LSEGAFHRFGSGSSSDFREKASGPLPGRTSATQRGQTCSAVTPRLPQKTHDLAMPRA
jgi:hypothetical protein